MTEKPAPNLSTYKVVPQKDGTYAVRWSVGPGASTLVHAFITEAEAQAWIEAEKKNAPDRNQRAKSIVDKVTRGD